MDNLNKRRLYKSYYTEDGLLCLNKEIESGNIEYKYCLINLSTDKIEKLSSQLKWRMNEGNGEALYIIGINDNGYPEGISNEELKESYINLEKMAKIIGGIVSIICKRKGRNGNIHEYLIRKINNNNKYIDIRIALLGENGVGKSTLVSVLSQNNLDDGNGSMRIFCFKHQYEFECGETTCLSHKILGFDINGNCINKYINNNSDELFYENELLIDSNDDISYNNNNLSYIVDKSHKIISFLDLPGRHSNKKTTIGAITGEYTDYGLIVMDSKTEKLNIEYIDLCIEFKIPIIIIITKIDLNNEISLLISDIKKYIKYKNKLINCELITNESELLIYLSEKMLVPIFKLSNVNGYGIELFIKYLNLLSLPNKYNNITSINANLEFRIDNVSFIEGIGTIIRGITTKGIIKLDDKLYIGPDSNSNFKKVSINNIYRNYKPVDIIECGNTATICLKGIGTSFIKRGMVLVNNKNINTYWNFTAIVTMLNYKLHSNKSYQPVIQCSTIRQPAKIIKIKNKKNLKTEDITELTFKFLKRPELIRENMKVIFTDDYCKGIGVIKNVF
jgi:elongation factor 1-alpha